MNKPKNIDYYIGLDCGTSSVGFAVTDTDYNVLKFNGKRMWGSHLFDEADTAATRRANRTARRRLERRKKRILLLQEIFAEEIYKVDPTFFIRLNDSKYALEDKTNPDMNILFNDESYKDKNFFKDYKTVYHLMKALREKEIHDPRLLYLGIQHILKHRGHFLFPGENMSAVNSIEPLLENIHEVFEELFGCTFEYSSVEKIEDALKAKKTADKKERLESEISIADKKLKTSFIKMLVGYKVKTTALFGNEDAEPFDIEFRTGSFDDKIPDLKDNLSDEEFSLIIAMKGIYDWAVLANIMNGYVFISDAKVHLYESNREDLKHLKNALAKYAPDKYDEFFHSDKDGYYSNYTGKIHDNRRHFKVKRTKTDVFYKTVKSLLEKAPKEDADVAFILDSIENDSFMPLLRSFRNGTIPWQVNKTELEAILQNAAKGFPFLDEKDDEGLTAHEKILDILKYRVPYYVGPLGANPNGKGTKGKNSWAERSESGRILPWNISQKVDFSSAAEEFIKRMTNKCTYCKDQDVLPKNSLSYAKYMVLNELNNIRIHGERLSVERKQDVFNNLFKKSKKVTLNGLVNYAIKEGWYAKDEIKRDDISGLDMEKDFNSSLAPYFDFRDFLESGKLKATDVDEIITWITVFPEGGDILKSKIKQVYGTVLTNTDIERISKLKYAGWGRFSHKFLYEIQAIDKRTGELMSVMRMLWETQNNLMELLSNDYEFIEQIDKPQSVGKLDYSIVDEMYVSPSVKRETWQTLRIVDELKRIMGHNPKKVFIEVTRADAEKKRTVSRKQTLIDVLKDAEKSDSNYANEIRELITQLDNRSESDIARQDKLYLYFSQCGKSAYSGKPIDIDDIYDTNLYDIDHIYPQSKTKDDSLANKVLVLKSENILKGDSYPIDDSIRAKMHGLWKFLYENKFIPKEKYNRLTRSTPLSNEDIRGFINRQLVETSQTVKQVANVLKGFFGDDTKIVYSKARNVSEFRDIYKLVKCRSMNDLHHAKDAYLNIVVGNTYDTKYTDKFYLQADGKGYGNLSTIFDYNVDGAWKAGKYGTIDLVKRTMDRNDILFTRQPVTKKGQLFDLQLVKKGAKKGALPAKTSDEKFKAFASRFDNMEDAYDAWTSKYGGYNSLATSHFAVVKNEEKGKKFVSFIAISMIDAKRLEQPEALLEYCTKTLGLKNPTIVRSKLLINTQIKIDGYLFAIAGKTGNRMTLKSNIPLILSNESQKTLKKIESFNRKKQTFKGLTLNEEHDGITNESVSELYRELMIKSSCRIYENRPSNQNETITSSFDKFETLTLSDKCRIITSLTDYFGMGNGVADLTLIESSKQSGTLLKGAKQDLAKSSVSIYDQSITGLFETIEEIKA